MINISKLECNFYSTTALQLYQRCCKNEYIKVIRKNKKFILVSQGWAGQITSRHIRTPVLRTYKITADIYF